MAAVPHATVVHSALELEPWVEQWDELAVQASRPYSAPGWLLPWWEHMRPRATVLRVVLLTDGASLVGVAPFFIQPGRGGRRDARLLGSGTSHGVGILDRGRDDSTSEVLARSLADLRPSLVSLENVDEDSSWHLSLRAAWPGAVRPRLVTTGRQVAPVVRLEGEYEEWLERRSRNFRQQLAQAHRRLEGAGGNVSFATSDSEREAAVAAFVRLHAERWSGRGGSNLKMDATGSMLRAAAARLGRDRFRLVTLVLDGEIAAVQVMVAAGGEVAYWNGGWDERHAKLRPGLLTLAAAIEDASRRGDRRFDLGGGADPYKLRFADEPVTTAATTRVLIPVGPRYPQVKLALAPMQLRRVALRGLERLPESHERRVRAWVRRTRAATRRGGS